MQSIWRPQTGADVISNPGGVSSQRRSYLPFILIEFAFAALALWLSSKLNLYIDELYSLHTTSHGFRYALEQSLGFEQQPPLFFLALTAWRSIDASDYFARLFSIGCSLATLFVTWRFARRYLRTLPDWLVPLGLAINPFFLWAALDIRVYALIVLLSALLVRLFFDAFGNERVSAIRAIAFTVVAIAALYTQYFIGTLFVGFAIALWCGGARRALLPFVLSMVAVALAILPLLLGSVAREFTEATAVHIVTPPVLAERMLASTLAFVFPHAWIGTRFELLGTAVYAAVVGATLIAIARYLRSNRSLTFLVTTDATAIALFLIAIIVARAPLEMPRHIAVLFVPTMLLLSAAIASAPARASRLRIATAYLLVLLLFSAAENLHTYRAPISNSGDWRRVGSFLNANVATTEPIAVFDPENALAVRHYYSGKALIVSIPHEQNFTVFDRRDFAIRSEKQLAAAFPAASPATGRLWLVSGATCGMSELGKSCSLLDSYVAAQFRSVAIHHFNGTNVRELEALRRIRLVRRNRL